MDDFADRYFNTNDSLGFSGARQWNNGGEQSSVFPAYTDWLTGQDAYTLHTPVVRKFRRRPTIVSGMGVQIQADLMDVRSLATYNNSINFILVAIDVFSKRGFAFPLKNKTGKVVATALKDLVSKYKFRVLQTDKGKEFYNKDVNTALADSKISHFSSENENVKASIVERFIKTLRNKINRYLTFTSNGEFVSKLEEIVESYNNTKHRSIGMKPVEVDYSNQEEVWQRLYEKTDWRNKSKPKLRIGDHVRLALARTAFERGYSERWTREVFVVTQVWRSERPVVYSIKDLGGEAVVGKFYSRELQKVKLPEVFAVESVIRTKGRGSQKQYFVKWKGYPDAFNSWVSHEDFGV